MPLALEHAGAYCADGVSFTEYHAQLTGLPARELFDTHPEVFYEQTVASTWKPSIAAATDAAALAGDVLELAAFLAPDAIPKELFDVLVDAPGEIRERKRLTDACNALARYSLATVDDATISLHRLLQKVIRDDLTDRDEAAPGAHAVAAITDAFPADTQLPACWDACERLLAHVQALAVAMPAPGEHAVTVVGLMNRVCVYLLHADSGALQRDDRAASEHAALMPRAVTLGQAAVELAQRLLDAEHPDTLRARANLASSYWQPGRTKDAIDLREAVLADRERLLGAEHPDTLRARANLAHIYRAAGSLDEAKRLDTGA